MNFRRGSGKRLSVYANSSFAPKYNESRSVSGGDAVFCGKTTVSWFTRTQRCVSLSSSEAEYIAASEAHREVIYLRGVLAFIQPSVPLDAILCPWTARGL